MVEAIKNKAIGMAALEVLEFASEFLGKWFEGFQQLKKDVEQGREPSHCSIRSEFDFWSWAEAIAYIEREAEALYQPMIEEVNSTKAALIQEAAQEVSLGELCVEHIASLDAKQRNAILVDELKKAVDKVNQERGDEHGHYSVESYSGRFMYGANCVALYIPEGAGEGPVAVELGKALKLFGTPLGDFMGRGTVTYRKPTPKYFGTRWVTRGRCPLPSMRSVWITTRSMLWAFVSRRLLSWKFVEPNAGKSGSGSGLIQIKECS